MNRELIKKPEIKPNLPGKEEINVLLTKNKMARAFRATDGRRYNPGRPPLWAPNEQARLHTRVKPSTHQFLSAKAEAQGCTLGAVIDELITIK